MNSRPRSRLPFALCMLFLAACSNQAVYTGESFADDSPFRMRADGEVATACESARRSLLGQGYLIESASSEGVKGRKAYRSEDAQSTFIEMNVVCLPETKGSTLYATGLLTTYALKKSTSSASVGLSALGSISLPIGQSADSLVKVSEETIDDKDFYKRFFTAVGNTMSEMQADRVLPEPVPEAVAVAPDPAPAAAAEPATPAEPTALHTVPGEPVTTPAPVDAAPAPEPASGQAEAVAAPVQRPAESGPAEPLTAEGTPLEAVLEPFPVPPAAVPESPGPTPQTQEVATPPQPAALEGAPVTGEEEPTPRFENLF
ncbi:MAG: DUF2242 domain-containing protein [Halioglobus sp.]